MEKILLQSLVVLSAVFLAACSQGVPTGNPLAGDNTPLKDPTSPTPPPTPTPDGSITIAQLTGSWQSSCQPFDDQTMKNKLTFSGSTVQVLTQVYSGSACSGSPIVIVNTTGTFSIKGLSTTVALATDFTIVVTQVTGTPQSDLVASQLNFIGYCGYSNWESGKARTVSLSNQCLVDLPLKGNQIARISNNTLYLGNASKTAINFSVGYTKQ